ncbi:MAG TPA: ABC transporter substrate-binding protein [Dermatophilaceae bacterium]
MVRRLSPAITLTAGAAIVGLALSACGSSSLSTPDASTKAPTAQAVDPALAAKLPAKIKSAGKIIVGTDATYAPNEFLNADGKTVQGMDVDLFNAVMQKFGVKVVWQPAGFDTIIAGVSSGKYDIGVSSFTINADRMKQANMVSYFNAGTQWATPPGNPKKINPASPCGFKVAVQKGTVQADTDMPPKVKACAAAGKPVDLQIYAGQDTATAAVANGKADAMLADSPVVAYAIKQSAGKIEAAGAVYDAAPYGYVLKKSDTEFAQAIVDALKSLDTSGAYKKALSNWGNEAGAISDFAVNPPVK